MKQQTYSNPAELIQRWFAVNQEFLQASTQALDTLGKDPTRLDDAYRHELQSARHAVNEILELEKDALDLFEEQGAATPPANSLSQLATSMSRNAVDLRARLWEAWFDQAESFGVSVSNSLSRGISNLAADPSSDQATSGAAGQATARETSSGTDGAKQDRQSGKRSAAR